MVLFVYFAEVLGIDLSVYLSGADVGVAEQCLDASQVGAPLEQVTGEGVS